MQPAHPSARRPIAAIVAACLMVLAGLAPAAGHTPAGEQFRVARDGTGWRTWRDHGPDGGIARPIQAEEARPVAARTTAPCPGAMGSSPGRFLRFVCVVGSGSGPWNASDRAALARTLRAMYPRLVGVYGQPMHTHTVTIVPDATLDGLAFYQSWYQVDASGMVVPGTCRAEIHLAPSDGRNARARIHYLPHEVLHAFHGCQAPPTPAVEEGMTEAAASLVRRPVADELGVPWDRPSEPSGVFATDSAVTIADQLNGPLMSAGRWTNAGGEPRPQLALLYSAAATSWWTLWRVDPAFFRDWNARWRSRDRHTHPATTRLTRVHRIAAELVPTIGFRSYAAWKSQQQVFGQRHAAGLRVLCGDASTQRGDGFMAGLVQVIGTGQNADDWIFTGDVRIAMVRPDGSHAFPPKTVGGDELGSGFVFDAMSDAGPVAHGDAGAYRLTVQRVSGSTLIGRCWFIGGFQSAGRLIVVAEPSQTVKAMVPRRVDGEIVQVTVKQAVGADRVAVFQGVAPGIAVVGLDGAAPTEVAPVGTRGAIVALSAP